MAKSSSPVQIVEPVLTPKTLSEKANFLVEHDSMTYTEAIIEICKELELEPEDVAKLVKKGPLKEKLQAEAVNRNIVKSTTAKLF
tara:strand:+ start:257 stop:511 length:255 start_codon:yes stop_codon:yes gene_type:complete